MFEYVQNAGLQFSSSLTKRSITNLIILHHVEGNMSVQAIHQMHKANGHKGIDYNIYVGLDGTVQWGRGMEYEGGHVSNSYAKTKGMNARSVGIVCNGNFNTQKMPAVQLEALQRVVSDVVKYYKFASETQVVSHKEAAGAGYTDCPGTYFPTTTVREYVRQQLSQPAEPEQPKPTPILPIPPADTDKPTIGGIEAEVCAVQMLWPVRLRSKPVKDTGGVEKVEFIVYPEGKADDPSAKTFICAKQNQNNMAMWSKEIAMDKPGNYVVRAKAYDKAGNASEYKGFAKFTIK